MAYLILPHRWRRQPTQPVGIAAAYADARFLWTPSIPLDLVSNSAPAISGVTTDVGRSGIESTVSSTGGSANYLSWGTSTRYDPPATGYTMFFYGRRLGESSGSYDRIFHRDLNNSAGNRFGFLIAPPGDGTAGNKVYFDNEVNTTEYGVGYSADNIVSSTTEYWMYMLSHNGSTASFYTNGRFMHSANCAVPNSSSRPMRIGASSAYVNPEGAPFKIVIAGLLPRGVSAGEAAELAREPFGLLFRRLQPRIYVPSAGTGGAVSVTLTGVEATGAVGSLSLSQSLALTGQAATGAVGTLAPTLSTALSGLAATGAVGSLAPSHALTLSGLAVTGAVGTLAPSHTVALTGLAVTGAVGTLTPLSGFNVLLSGQEATGAVGTFSLSQTKALSGLEATGAVGLLSPVSGITVALTGLAATGAVGSLTTAVSVALSGLEVTGAIGSFGLSTPTDVDLTGLEATAALGLLTPSSYAITTVRPDADDSAGAWLPSAGSDLYAMVDEAVLDDGDYIYTESASTCRLSLGAMTDPGVNYAHRINYRIKGNGSVTITVRLGATSTTVATWTHTPAPSSLTTYTQTLDSGEVDTWRANSGYSSGWIEFEAT